ncbi:hypothetical protein [Rhodococcus wratislaviensis]|uniref:hypothetical protein n=1 Tax=Rhodococcus wratislaviensis TaxID=44752 RepID=UPI003661B13A
MQVTRTVSNRERTLVLVNGPDGAKWEFLKQSGLGPEAIEESMSKRQAAPKHEALDLMIKDVQNVTARGFIFENGPCTARTRLSSPAMTRSFSSRGLRAPGTARVWLGTVRSRSTR